MSRNDYPPRSGGPYPLRCDYPSQTNYPPRHDYPPRNEYGYVLPSQLPAENGYPYATPSAPAPASAQIDPYSAFTAVYSALSSLATAATTPATQPMASQSSPSPVNSLATALGLDANTLASLYGAFRPQAVPAPTSAPAPTAVPPSTSPSPYYPTTTPAYGPQTAYTEYVASRGSRDFQPYRK